MSISTTSETKMELNIGKLIECMSFKSPIWDKRDPDHHKAHVIENLWDDVAKEMKWDKNLLKSKWKSIKERYCEEILYYPKTSNNNLWEAPWPYIDSLGFLKDNVQINMSLEKNTIDSDDTSLNSSIFPPTPGNLNAHEGSSPDSLNDHDSVKSSPGRILPEAGGARKPKKTAKKRKRSYDLEEVLTVLKNIKEQKKQKCYDEDESFFDSLLPHIADLPAEKKLLLRLRMQKLVYKFVYNDDPIAFNTLKQSKDAGVEACKTRSVKTIN